MAGLISSTEAVAIRQALSVFRTHTCTLTPADVPVLDEGQPVLDDWGEPTYTPGTPVTLVPCKYVPQDSVAIGNVGFRDAGTITRRMPTLTVAHDLSVSINDTVSAITNSEGVVLLAGPAVVEEITPSSGLGPTLSKRLVLRASGVVT